ncbi:hypothetical protein ACFPOI_43840 [Nonomuraea angiospora]|uniref:Uncharacterized protein n=1 Tax=Nonomuraea angiospora TaxID=46172 RepID=A0ABR9LNP7_9ACTN|nr:hypothetical protein [Nonomuraea angiospora]MBE1582276.1 hypothetical protein [Nonomuraea angiospora]
MDLRHAWRQVVPTPPEYRDLIDLDRTRQILRCPRLDPASIPGAIQVEGRTYYDARDMYNLALYSGLGNTQPELEMKHLGRIVVHSDRTRALWFNVVMSATCPQATACESYDWEAPELCGSAWDKRITVAGRAEWHGVITRQGTNATIQDTRIGEVWQYALQRYRYHYTPPKLSIEVSYTSRWNIGDCVGLSLALADHLKDIKRDSHMRVGYLVAGLGAQRHAWVEVVDSDGLTKTLDLSLACLAPRFFTKEYAAFCFGSTLNRALPLAKGELGVVRHHCRGLRIVLRPDLQAAQGRPPRPAISPS